VLVGNVFDTAATTLVSSTFKNDRICKGIVVATETMGITLTDIDADIDAQPLFLKVKQPKGENRSIIPSY
jgi:hypothetical protein